MMAIINLSTKKYEKGQLRLRGSLEDKTDADILFYSKESEVGARSHRESMYGFKPKAFQQAWIMGYRKIVWLDASIVAIKDLNPIFEAIEKDGYFFQDSGWMNSRWTPQHVKDYFGTDEGKMISSGVVGLNLENQMAINFLYLWLKAMGAGMFNGSHDVYRHDQSCASLIIQNLGLKITDNNTFWNYGKEPMHDGIVALADGIC